MMKFMSETEDGVPETNICSSTSLFLIIEMKYKDAAHSDDPFGLYDLLKNKKGTTNHVPSPSLSHPPGFTPVTSENRVENLTETGAPKVFNAQVMNSSQDIPAIQMEWLREGFRKHHRKLGEIMLLDEFAQSINIQGLGHKTKKEWIKTLTNSFKLNFLAIQETKMTSISHMDVKFLWGNSNYDYVCSESLGNSGGILCIWEASIFKKINTTVSDNFIAIYGTWLPTNSKILFIAIYAPQQTSCKRKLWDYISNIVGRWNGESIIMGDFNEVRSSEERRGSYNFQKSKSQVGGIGDETQNSHMASSIKRRAHLAIRGPFSLRSLGNQNQVKAIVEGSDLRILVSLSGTLGIGSFLKNTPPDYSKIFDANSFFVRSIGVKVVVIRRFLGTIG
ncbi:RNA-directed DNA polymerase, eukaryota [Tanacetum coccineum]|uniref:RNA-directed DNA polymerase, eukaryota n=1 Tax=Tanacetum coccineum TaxID=301880 RepID=A0ABQ5CU18_9ASTR